MLESLEEILKEKTPAGKKLNLFPKFNMEKLKSLELLYPALQQVLYAQLKSKTDRTYVNSSY